VSDAPSPEFVPDAVIAIPAPDVVPRRRLWPGVLAWLAICAAFLIADFFHLVDGLDLPVPLVIALVLARVVDERPRLRRWIRTGALVVAVIGFGLACVAWLSRARVPLPDPTALAGIAAATALLGAFTVRRLRRAVLSPIGLDPSSAVHTVVVIAVAVTLITSVVVFVGLQDTPDETIYFHPSDSAVSLLSDAALALAGIGFLLTRGVRASIRRLDLRRMRVRQLVLAVALAAAFLVVVGVMERVESVWLPAVHAREDRFDYEFVGVPPLVGAILLSVAAGIGEELVFRGALQPRLGVILTAAVFAGVHVQYQIPGLLMIFLVGLGLGLIKRYSSTTFTVCVHVFYDVGAFLLPDF
jgi:membrane protease YdiL (CAAX protease family)